MTEVIIKVDIPLELKKEFESALSKVVSQFVRRVEFSIADEILLKSKLTDSQIDKLSDGLKERVAKRHRV